MNVYVVPEPERQTLRVYVMLHDDGEHRWFQTTEGPPMSVDAGAEPPMFMRIDERIAEAIAEALAPRPEATERHLDDAIKVRDALLGMVERAAYPAVVTER